ncbi:MAG: histidinol-phosphate transaminase [Gaiellaceae bacterium MAG52_C11]|nr:histidinol-phosphate transaminase [Candidatus Gaiellasilicea maunaloa]
MSFFRPALDGLVPYEPGKPEEEVQRELGLERVVKLASNEGPWGPFPAALEAMERSAGLLNRYPDGGAFHLANALAERHGVTSAEVITGAGADAIIGHLSVATLDPGDEIVTGWPSFISYVLDALKVGAAPQRVPLRDHHLDLDAMLAAIGPRTKLVYIATPNNPTGTMTGRKELDDYFERVPAHLLTVVDQAYFEYIDEPDYPDAVEEYLKTGRRVLVLRTFSKIYGLAGLRVGYGVGAPDVIQGIAKIRRAFDVNTQAQVAALASLDDPAELERRRRLTAEGRATLVGTLREHGLEPAGPAVANFLLADVGDDAGPLFEALLRQGAIVRPLTAFGAPGALRITVGTPEENAFFADALACVRAAAR